MGTLSTCNLQMQRFSHMHTTSGLQRQGVPKLKPDQEATRGRIARWVRAYRKRYEHRFHDDAEFAGHLGISPSHLSNILSGARTPGMDVALKMSAVFQIETDRLLKDEPTETGAPPTPEPPAHPVPASSSPARPRGRRAGGGRR